MLEKNSSSYPQSGVFPSSAGSNSVKEAATLTSDNTTLNYDSKYGVEFRAKAGILDDKFPAVDNSSFSYTLGDADRPDTNPEFFENSEGKDPSDFLYYGWPEIGDFEDVDRMFRSCDSTFWLGSSKEGELDWISSAGVVGASREVVKSGFEFPAPESNTAGHSSRNHDSRGYSMNCSPSTGTSVSSKGSSLTSEGSDSFMSFLNDPGMEDCKGEFLPKKEIYKYGNEFKQRKQRRGKRKDQFVENDSFSNMSSLAEEVILLPFEATSCQGFPPFQNQQQEEASALAPRGAPLYARSDNSCFSDLTALDPTQHAVESQANYMTFPSPRDSLASSQLRTVDSLHDSTCQVPVPAEGAKMSLHDSTCQVPVPAEGAKMEEPPCQGGRSSMNSSPRSAGENHGDIEGANLATAEISTSSNIQGLTMSPMVDDISLEAAGFHKLQLVMEQLDQRTKLCIRDSLYRLARSAEHRHNHAKSNNHLDNERATKLSFLSQGTNSLMDIETDTNPIDRSVAHLLFHRPSESFQGPANDDSLPLDSPCIIHESVRPPPFLVDNSASCGETASEWGRIPGQ